MIKPMKTTKQTGLTLLEVLIALLVLAIGMAGLGALLLTALSNVHSASQFSLASAIALDFEERLWHEVSLRSADDPSSLNQGCLTDAQIQAMATDLAEQWTAQNADDDWNWTTVDRFRAPGLNLNVAESVVTASASNAGISWQRIPMTIEWTEARFGVTDDTEVYPVTVAVVCRPVF